MSVDSGWGRFTWGRAYWGEDETLATGWGAKSWGAGEWGNLADETVTLTGQSISSNVGSVTVTAGAAVDLIGQQFTSSNVPEPPTVTAQADAQISTAQSKFGGSSLLLDGTGDRIQSSDITLGTDSYTFETFAYYNSFASTQCLWDAGENVGASQNPVVYITSTNLQLSYAGGTYINVAHGMSTNTWHHIAITRNGSTLTAYIDGTSIGTGTYSGGSGATNHVIGGNYAGTYTTNGYLDETRLTRRVIYTGNFTPPTEAFTPSTDDELLLHYDGSNGSTTITNSALVAFEYVTANANVAQTGVSFTASVDDLAVQTDVSVELSGQSIASALGVITPADQVMGLTGQEFTAEQGTAVAPNEDVSISGFEITSELGSVIADTRTIVAPTGFEITSEQGTAVAPNNSVTLQGQEAEFTLGQLVGLGSSVVTLTGQEVTSAVGDLEVADQVVGLTGVQFGSNVGSIDLDDQIVGLESFEITASLTSPFIVHYEDVDTGSNTSYSGVSTGSNTSYSDVATGDNTNYTEAA